MGAPRRSSSRTLGPLLDQGDGLQGRGERIEASGKVTRSSGHADRVHQPQPLHLLQGEHSLQRGLALEGPYGIETLAEAMSEGGPQLVQAGPVGRRQARWSLADELDEQLLLVQP